ncbi:putative reverse transcriptase domain-containing protein [Tanacetum coccineum]|uniref:Reverse transcriptase domain-containing protein n=1 Tax=Tanacetum coccineum TaxID=301880 RepID=A0ABQ5HM71_9ASTR
MSDSEHSTVTYTSVSEDDLDMGSPGVESTFRCLLIFEVPPSPDYIPGPEGPPSPDYVPGPEEPEQAPPSPIYIPFVPEPVYPEFLPVDDEPEEDLEENDEEDPEEDPADYPEADRGDDDDAHLAPADPAAAPAPFLSEEVAERVLALPTPPPSPLSPYSSPLPQIPSPPLPIPSPISPTYVEGSLGSRAAGIRQRDALPSPIHETEMPEMCLPLRKRPCRTTPGPGYEVGESSTAGAARQVGPTTARADLYGFADTLEAAPGRRMSRELGYGIRDTWDDLVGAIQEIAPTTLEGGELAENQTIETETVSGGTKDSERPLQDSDERASTGSRDLLRTLARPELRQRRPVAVLRLCSAENGTKRKAHKNSEVKGQSRNSRHRSPQLTHQSQTQLPTTSVTQCPLGMPRSIEGVTAVLAARATTRNGDDSHTSGTGARRNERTIRECTYQDFMKCQPLFFKGTEGVVSLTQWFERMETVFRISNCTVENQVKFATCTLMGTALTWWNSHARTVTNEVAYAMTWSDLKKKMTTKYCPRNEIKKIEAELWNLKVKGTDVVAYNQRFQELALLCDRMFPEETDKIERYVGGMPDLIYSSVVASKPKTMQEAIEMATELMDRRINTLAERQTENKRKFEDAPRNNQNQQPNKRQNTGRAYAAGNGDKKPYEGTKPRCPKCNFNHYGPCMPTCNNCKKLGHLAKDCRSRPATANNNNRNNNNNNNRNNNNPRAQGANTNAIVCFECGAPGHFRKDCPQWKNKNQGNGNGVARAYAVGVAGQNPDNNVVTGTFLLNNRCASILFDTGADRSFVSTQFSALINIAPTKFSEPSVSRRPNACRNGYL